MDLACLLTGYEAPDLVDVGHCQLEKRSAAAFSKLQQAGKAAGFDLQLVSGYRSFQRQLLIWNGKLTGLRPVFDAAMSRVDLQQLSGFAKLEAVLLYSALPGGSRHHWGTDLDLYDAAAVPADYQPQLLASEYLPGGPFAAANAWLSQQAGQYGFFRPYQRYCGGVAAEPWHFSFQPMASIYLQQFQPQMLHTALQNAEVIEKDLILQHLPIIFDRYIRTICEEIL